MAMKTDRKTGISILIGTALVLGICLFSAGCLSTSPDTDGGALDGTDTKTDRAPLLNGTDWQLKSYGNGTNEMVSVIEGSEITLTFDEDGGIAGSAGVNRYFASYEARGDALSFGLIGSTMMAGPEDAMMQESKYLKLLNETASFTIEDDELKLYDSDGTVLLVFEKIPPVTAESLKGKEWVLTSYNNGNEAIVSVIAGTEITLDFDEEGRIAGSAGVNRYFASYEAGGDALTFGVTGSTMMAGPEDAMMQETTYLKLLNETASFSGVGDELKLYDSDKTVLLVFKRAVPPASESLTGTTWVLDSYNNDNEAIVSVIAGTKVTLTLDEDGGIAGSAGCNNYFASYETDGDALTFGPVGSTEMFCDEPEGTMAQETIYLKLLNTAAGYEIEGDTLAVQDSTDTTILTFTAAE
ncbi:META domain-containing protein [Methanogenium marinum]|uniref:META domain-containing protein n=1 Tax=Methanogenium marinum TaxID=348610 RepID=A0A9Q4KUT2_9EURY|nr:META domain-containing protein [Methanogenium marinum]MDE4907686.1 META domain-containing protein [Methanogenium marinum]